MTNNLQNHKAQKAKVNMFHTCVIEVVKEQDLVDHHS